MGARSDREIIQMLGLGYMDDYHLYTELIDGDRVEKLFVYDYYFDGEKMNGIIIIYIESCIPEVIPVSSGANIKPFMFLMMLIILIIL